MGQKWIFFSDGQFLTISLKITYARFAMTEIEGEKEEITSPDKNFLGES